MWLDTGLMLNNVLQKPIKRQSAGVQLEKHEIAVFYCVEEKN